MLIPEDQIFVRFALRLTFSEIQHVQARAAKIGNAPNGPKLNLNTCQNILYTLNTYYRSPNFGPFCSTTGRFQDTSSSNIGNAPNDPKLNLNT